MAAVVNRAAADKAFGFFRLSSYLIRALSSTTTTTTPSTSSAAASADEVLKKPKRKKRKNLFEVAQFLPNWGIGYKMAKNHWRGVSYEITKINLYKDGRHGKAWGIVHKDEVCPSGLPPADAPKKISGVHKRGWRYIPEPRRKIQDTPKPAEQSLAS